MSERAEIIASVAGSLRLEGLQASPHMRELLDRWARGEVSEATLREAERRVLARQPLDDLIAAPSSTGTPRAA
jgi:hypothetical protein